VGHALLTIYIRTDDFGTFLRKSHNPKGLHLSALPLRNLNGRLRLVETEEFGLHVALEDEILFEFFL
jgi:hypothetical protein